MSNNSSGQKVKIKLTPKQCGEVAQCIDWAITQLYDWRRVSVDKPSYDTEIKRANEYFELFYDNSDKTIEEDE